MVAALPVRRALGAQAARGLLQEHEGTLEAVVQAGTRELQEMEISPLTPHLPALWQSTHQMPYV